MVDDKNKASVRANHFLFNLYYNLSDTCVKMATMDGPDEFKLCVNAIFFSWQTVSGYIKISSRKELTNINHIQVKIVGFSHVQWKEVRRSTRFVHQVPGSQDTREMVYENHQDLIITKKILHEGSLQEGEHTIPFEFTLPINLPGSFEGQYGHIRYYVEAKLDHSGILTTNKRLRQYITICSLVDLNKLPDEALPFTTSREKEFENNCCFISGGHVTVNFSLPRTCFTPGEFIPITADIENNSDITIKSTSAVLVMKVNYATRNGKTIITKNILLARKEDKIKEGRRSTWHELPLCTQSEVSGYFSSPKWTEPSPIPCVPPSSKCNECDLINITYQLEFNIIAKGYKRPFICLNIPIIIGSIPFRSTFSDTNTRNIESREDQVTSTSDPLAPTMQSEDYSDLPPPSYAEAAVMDCSSPNNLLRPNDKEEIHANWDFRPTYPIWNGISNVPKIQSGCNHAVISVLKNYWHPCTLNQNLGS